MPFLWYRMYSHMNRGMMAPYKPCKDQMWCCHVTHKNWKKLSESKANLAFHAHMIVWTGWCELSFKSKYRSRHINVETTLKQRWINATFHRWKPSKNNYEIRFNVEISLLFQRHNMNAESTLTIMSTLISTTFRPKLNQISTLLQRHN